MTLEEQEANKAIKVLRKFCSKFRYCWDCPFVETYPLRCGIKQPYKFKILKDEENDE